MISTAQQSARATVALCEPEKGVPAEVGELKLEIVNPEMDGSWEEILQTHPAATPFHATAWARVLTRSYGHRTFYLRWYEGDRLIALLPVMEVRSRATGCRGIALPFSDFCQPLFFASGARGQSSAMLSLLISLGQERGWRYFEGRGPSGELFEGLPARQRYFHHVLDLSPDEETLFAGFKSRVRGAIRKAEKAEVTTVVANDWRGMQEFYHLQARTRRRHGLPPQPLSFFRHLQNEMAAQGFAFTVTARRGGAAVAAAVFFHAGPWGIYKYAASDERVRDCAGNNLVLWHGMRELLRRGAPLLDLGRTALPNEGLRAFKLSWGALEEELGYFRYDFRQRQWSPEPSAGRSRSLSSFPTKVFRHLPLPLNRLVGAMVYPHLD